MYEYADKVIRGLNRVFIREFGNFTIKIDELNVLSAAKKMYSRMDKAARRGFVKIAKNKKADLDDTFIMAILLDYDPVVKYVYAHEVERKRMRFAEAYIAGDGNRTDVKRALRLWSAMIGQFGITVTDKAYIADLKARGIKYVRWVTTPDERLCAVCAALHDKIFAIDKIPPKPHINCRCYVEPVKK